MILMMKRCNDTSDNNCVFSMFMSCLSTIGIFLFRSGPTVINLSNPLGIISVLSFLSKITVEKQKYDHTYYHRVPTLITVL